MDLRYAFPISVLAYTTNHYRVRLYQKEKTVITVMEVKKGPMIARNF